MIARAALIAVALAGCKRSTPPEPSPPPEPAKPDEPAEPDETPETEVVKLPWEGEIAERQDFCRPPREPLLDTSTGVFRRVEIRAGGLELIERGVYRDGPIEQVVVHGSGCTHDTVSITFTATDPTPATDVEHYRALAREALRDLPVTAEPPSYPDILADVLETGSFDPETPNLLVHPGDAIVTFEVEPSGDGRVAIKARYDFPI